MSVVNGVRDDSIDVRLLIVYCVAIGVIILSDQTRFLSSKGWHQVVEQTPGGQPVLGGSIVVFGVMMLFGLRSTPVWFRIAPYLGAGAWNLLVGFSFLVSTINNISGGTPGLVAYPIFGAIFITSGLNQRKRA